MLASWQSDVQKNNIMVKIRWNTYIFHEYYKQLEEDAIVKVYNTIIQITFEYISFN